MKTRTRSDEVESLVLELCSARWNKNIYGPEYTDLLEKVLQACEDEAMERLRVAVNEANDVLAGKDV